jgi:CMP-N-acetylneuraminic acid synthetase
MKTFLVRMPTVLVTRFNDRHAAYIKRDACLEQLLSLYEENALPPLDPCEDYSQVCICLQHTSAVTHDHIRKAFYRLVTQLDKTFLVLDR